MIYFSAQRIGLGSLLSAALIAGLCWTPSGLLHAQGIIELTTQFPSRQAGSSNLDSLIGRKVRLKEGVTCSAVDGQGFVWVRAGQERSFREPGLPYPGDPKFPVWDGNPEVFRLYVGNKTVSATMPVYAVGTIEENDGPVLYPDTLKISNSAVATYVPQKGSNDFSIASINALTFFANDPSYSKRLRKMARYIITQMAGPDIIAFQEVESPGVLAQVAEEVKRLNDTLNYKAYGFKFNSGNFPINLCYLVSDRLRITTAELVGSTEQFSMGGRLHDRPPMLLEGFIKTDPEIPFHILNIHMRSLIDILNPSIQRRRSEQAISIARMIRALQARGDENILVVGDFNAYEFTDGHVDVVNQITGEPSLGAAFETIPVLEKPLINYSTTLLPKEERYSYVFNGNAQLLDHCLGDMGRGVSIKSLNYTRGNADNPYDYAADPGHSLHVSDHDGWVMTLTLNNPWTTPALIPGAARAWWPNPFSPELHQVTVEVPESGTWEYQLVSSLGQIVQNGRLDAPAGGVYNWSLPTVIPNGPYFIKISQGDQSFQSLLIITGQ